MKKTFILLSLFILGVFVTPSCKAPYKRGKVKGGLHKGRQQPKKGPMPCPQKDC